MPTEPHLIAPTLLVDFAALPVGWNMVSFKVGPFGDLTLLLSEDPNPQSESETVSRTVFAGDAARRSRDRAVHLATGREPSASFDIPAMKLPTWSVDRLSDDRWLIDLLHEYHKEDPNAFILSGDGQELTRFWIGDGDHQILSDGRFWCAYNDQGIFGGSELESGGLVCLDLTGRLLFRFNRYDTGEAIGVDGTPEIWSALSLNVVSNDEVWLSYHASDALEENAKGKEFGALVRLLRYHVDRLWSWRIVKEQAPIEDQLSFAILSDRLLTPGFVYGLENRLPTADHPNARLFDVPLTGGGATDYLPIDDNGNWIGPFYAYGRGSRLYLKTERGIYVVDMANLPDISAS